MADGDLAAHRSLRWHNRRVMAERREWPAGHLETCERLDDEHAGWYTNWHPGDQCFTATHTIRQLSYRYARARTVEELVVKMAEADKLAAAQLAEWQLITPRGWKVFRSQ
jgi:hypothetical protein